MDTHNEEHTYMTESFATLYFKKFFHQVTTWQDTTSEVSNENSNGNGKEEEGEEKKVQVAVTRPKRKKGRKTKVEQIDLTQDSGSD